MKFNDEDIAICTNCDAEFTVHRLDDDDDEDQVQFCPYCGHHLWEDMDDDYVSDDEDE